jgi:EAL domain-containing protein (putative c-di-GMP-specific phosphodiesterase class I)
LVEISRPVDLDGLPSYRPLASLGIASYPEHGVTSDELMRSADTAMYAAKAKLSPVAAFDAQMREKATEVLEIRNALIGAVERGEFRLFYQPIVRLSDGGIVGAEALLRWLSPGRGLLVPAEFLHMAQMTGQLREIDRWVLHQAASDVAGWRELGLFGPDWWVSVNQTAEDLVQPDWIDCVAEAARLSGPASLQIELTEGQVSASIEVLQRRLRALEGYGVKLAVDDFGTGYSNLSSLCSLPITTVKIDRSFVEGIEKRPQAQTLVRVMIGLASQFGYSVVAEGIETASQRSVLSEAGCEMGQGYHFSRPLDAASFQGYLLNELARSALRGEGLATQE